MSNQLETVAAGEPGTSSKARSEPWVLRLYVNNQTPKSIAAFARAKKLCEERLEGQYRLDLVDLAKNPQLAEGDQIVAVPTLVRYLPEPMCKVVGDLADEERTLVGLQLRPPSPAALAEEGPAEERLKTAYSPMLTSLATRALMERLLATPGREKAVFRLYVTSMSPRSIESIAAIRVVCDQFLRDRYELDVVNLTEHPELAEKDGVVATPMLVRELPLPARKLVGDLTKPDRIILVLE